MPPLHVRLEIRGLIKPPTTKPALERRDDRMNQLMFPQVANLCKHLLARLALKRLINKVVLLVVVSLQRGHTLEPLAAILALVWMCLCPEGSIVTSLPFLCRRSLQVVPELLRVFPQVS